MTTETKKREIALDTYNLLGTYVDVFKDDPIFEQHEKWWMVPMHLLQPLFVARYDLPLDEYGDVIDPERQVEFIRNRHPNCLLVY